MKREPGSEQKADGLQHTYRKIANRSGGVEMISGPLTLNIVRFVLPLAFTGILQQLFNAADLAVVGQFVGKEAMAAVGSNSSVIGLIVNLFIGISLGTNIVIAQATGQNNTEKIHHAVHSSIVVALVSGFAMTLLGECITGPVISALGVPADVYDMAVTYLRIYFCGMPVILLYNFESAILRSRGFSRIPLIALLISGVINVILNLFFVIVVHMQVAGVALATVISNGISSLILFGILLRIDDEIRIDVHSLRIYRNVLSEILKIGVPAGLQSMLFSFSNIIVQSAINSLGSVVMAASSAAFNLEIITYYVMNAYGQACSTFVGQNYGAGKAQRCRKVLKTCLILDILSTGSVYSLILIFGHPLLGLFNPDAEVIRIGMIRLEYIALTYLFSFIQEVFSGYLRGFGISHIPAIVAVFGICGTRILWIFFVFPQAPSFTRIMQVYPVSLAITASVILIVTSAVKPSRKYIGTGRSEKI